MYRLFCTIALFPFFASAAPLFEWTFEEAAGTALSETRNTGSLRGTWGADFDQTATNGGGQLIVRRTPGGAANAFVSIETTPGSDFPDPSWVVLELGGWRFGGTQATETIRLGIADTTHEMRPSVLAQIRFGRNEAGNVYALGEGFGDGATESLEMPIFPDAIDDPVTLLLEVNQADSTFNLFYQLGDNPFLALGNGSLDPERRASFVRLGFSGHFQARGEFVAINRIAVLGTDPRND